MLGANDEFASDAPQTLREQEITKSCVEIVDEHRNRTIDGSRAVLRLTGILPRREQETVLVRYLDQIHKTERARASAEQCGKQVNSGRSQSTLDTRIDHSINVGDEVRRETGESGNNDAGLHKRPNINFTDDNASTILKRQCNKCLYGWKHDYVMPSPVEEPANPILERTLRLKQN
ncbi:hypothetical protein K439DRAFT_1614202 [Ramaria rubella]|nr:hypothetical protein K439DRAFT_1614202 [Ramaria rubella]